MPSIVTVFGDMLPPQAAWGLPCHRHTDGHPPLLLFAALLIGATAGGVWGAFFAGPVAAVVYATARVYYGQLRRTSPLVRSADSESPPAPAGEPLVISRREPSGVPQSRPREAVGPRSSSPTRSSE